MQDKTSSVEYDVFKLASKIKLWLILKILPLTTHLDKDKRQVVTQYKGKSGYWCCSYISIDPFPSIPKYTYRFKNRTLAVEE